MAAYRQDADMTIAEWKKLTYAERETWECCVCGNRPDDDGELRHGRGCYTQSEDGGGSSFVIFTDDAAR